MVVSVLDKSLMKVSSAFGCVRARARARVHRSYIANNNAVRVASLGSSTTGSSSGYRLHGFARSGSS